MRRSTDRRLSTTRERQSRVRAAILPGPRPPRLTKFQIFQNKKDSKIYDWYGLQRPPRLVRYPHVYHGQGAIDFQDLQELKSKVAILNEIVLRVSVPDTVDEDTYEYFFPKLERRQNLVQYLHDLFLPVENFPMNKELHELKGRYLGVFDVIDEKLRELDVRVQRRVYISARNDDFLGQMFTVVVNIAREELDANRKKVDLLLSYDPSDPNDSLGLGGWVPRPALDEEFILLHS